MVSPGHTSNFQRQKKKERNAKLRQARFVAKNGSTVMPHELNFQVLDKNGQHIAYVMDLEHAIRVAGMESTDQKAATTTQRNVGSQRPS